MSFCSNCVNPRVPRRAIAAIPALFRPVLSTARGPFLSDILVNPWRNMPPRFSYMDISLANLSGKMTCNNEAAEASTNSLAFLSLSLSLIAISAVIHQPNLIYVGIACFAFGDATASPMLAGLLSRVAGPEKQGLVQGSNQSVTALGRIIGPL